MPLGIGLGGLALLALAMFFDALVAPGSRATPLQGSSQDSYELLPANYALRGVALAAGKHRLRLEYAPTALHTGAMISALAWTAWLVAGFALLRRKRGERGA